MSLRVWIPGSKDFTDQGLDNIQWINDNVTLNNSGKLGKCLYFNGTNARLSTTNFNIGNTFSFCCWYKNEDITRASWGYLILLNATGTDSDAQLAMLTKPGERTECTANGQWYSTITHVVGAWNHIAATFDGTTLKCYLNGTFFAEKAITQQLTKTNLTIGARANSASGGHASATGFFQGFMNDVRIYDHVISEKEIKLISMGMVRHYPLDNNGMGMPNVLRGSVLTNLPSPYSGATMTRQDNVAIPEFGCKNGIRVYGKGGSSVAVGLFNSVFPEAVNDNNRSIDGQKYSFSIYIKNNHASNTVQISFNALTGASAQNIEPKVAKKLVATGTGDGTKVLQIIINTLSAGQDYDITFWHPKIEMSDHATPWCQASDAAGYIATTIEYDVSGNRYDGTRTGTIVNNYDTAKYQVSTSFDGTAANYITADCLPAETKTISLWVKVASVTSMVGFVDYATNFAFGFNGTGNIITYCGTAAGGAGSQVLIGSNYKAGEWNHVVIISTGTNTRDCWLNGVKLSNASNNWWSHSTSNLMIGRRAATSYSFNGSLSDFRAYATVLSESDIQELYHAGISVSKPGMMIAPEFVEEI